MLTALRTVLGLSYNELQIANPSLAGELNAAVMAHGQNLTGDQATTPLRWVPIALQILDEARLEEVLAMVSLGTIGQTAVRALGRPEAIDPAALSQLVSNGSIATIQAGELGQAVERYRLCDEDTALVAKVGMTASGQTNADLAGRTAAQWLTALTGVGAVPPAGVTLAAVAETLARRLEILYPVSAWLGRLVLVTAGPVQADLGAIVLLEARNAHRFDGPFEALDLADVPAGQVASVHAAWDRLAAIVHGYAGLGLAAIFDDYTRTAAQRATDAFARTSALVDRITAAGNGHPRTDLLALDLSNGGAGWTRWALGAIDAGLRPSVVACVRTFQRMRSVAGDLDTAGLLMQDRFTSAGQIARLRKAAFIDRSGLDEPRGARVWEAARRLGTDAAVYVGAVVDQLGGAADPPMLQPPPTVGQSFTALDGYASLFGSQSFCDCTHCASVLGPAAYFVDLMEFVKQEVAEQVPTGDELELQVRRPDLWTTPLTCESTNQVVPTLTIVNEVLENDLARRTGYSGAWNDRDAIEAHVYQTAMPASTDSFVQPFTLGIERASAVLSAFGVSRASLGEARGVADGALRRLVLGVSTPWESLVTVPRLDLPGLVEVYGLELTGTPAAVDHVEGIVLAAAMGTDRAGLTTLLATWFVGRSVTSPRIEAAHRGPGSIQNDIEWVEDLTADALDRMHRLSRLADVLGVPVTVVDRQLRAANDAAINTATLDRLAAVAILADRIGTTFGEDDEVALGAGADQGIFDRRFNRGVRVAEAWPKPTARFRHPAFLAGLAAPNDGSAARLAAGLGLTDDAAVALIRFLAPILERDGAASFDPSAADPDERYFLLSAANLATLDRYARLLRLLGLAVGDLVQLMALAELPLFADVGGALAVARERDAWKASGRTLDELAIAGGVAARGAVAGFRPDVAVAGIRAGALDALTVGDAIFATDRLGLTPDASLAVIDENPLWFETIDADGVSHRVIERSVDPATMAINVPSGVSATVAELREVLLTRSARARITRGLAKAAERPDGEVLALYGLAREDVDADVVGDLLDGGAAQPYLADLVTAILRVGVATRGWSAGAIELLTNQPVRFGGGTWPTLVGGGAHPSAPWFSFAQAVALGRAAPRTNQAELHAAITAAVAAFDPMTQQFAPSVHATVATLVGTDVATIASLHGQLELGAGAIQALDRLARLAGMCRALGVDGRVLMSISAEVDADRVTAAVAIERAASARGETVAAVATKLEELRQAMRERCRDALVDYFLRSITAPDFRDAVELSNRFLLDVAAGGCATTSRVVAATNSVQEYVTRITLGLERNDLPPDDPAHVAVTLSPEGRATWEWRRSYRVWEANRKVFLWPENYLEGSLRDDKTPLFRQLEEALFQSALDEASIIGAYTTYLQGVDELADLRIAGAYHDVGADPGGAGKDVLHLIGVTDSDPLVFYYRSVTDLNAAASHADRAVVWSAWQKLDLPIESRVVSPVIHQGRMHLLWCKVQTRARQRLMGGNMAFEGYQHALTLSMVSQQPTGQWGAAQTITIPRQIHQVLFSPGPGMVIDTLMGNGTTYDPDSWFHPEPRDGFTLTSAPWLGVWPTVSSGVLTIRYRNFRANGDLDPYTRSLTSSQSLAPGVARPYIGLDLGQITAGTPLTPFLPETALGNLLIRRRHVERFASDNGNFYYNANIHAAPVYARTLAIATSEPDGLAVTGSPSDAILRIGRDTFHLSSPRASHEHHVIRRLGSSTTRALGRVLFERGLDGLLSIAHQMSLGEAPLPMTIQAGLIVDRSGAGGIDYRGPMGIYLRELFFHIPMLVATTMAARGRFADARRWFHRAFDPTTTEVIDLTGVPADEAEHRALDRVWRYRELRGLTPDRARAILTEPAALAAYRRDPFNPHAIARHRLSAYKRYAFGRYVDNLLDWGDSLFGQFTRETVEEARLLYQIASQLLGARPARLGDCGTGDVEPLDYEHIAPLLGLTAEITGAAETELIGARSHALTDGNDVVGDVAANARMAHVREQFAMAPAPPSTPVSLAGEWLGDRIGAWAPPLSIGTSDGALGLGGQVGALARESTDADSLASTLVTQLGAVFCVPVNKALLARWDRVEDRLWKIHHCLDLDGNRRELTLFAPELDVMTRVTAQSYGIAPEQLDLGRGAVPPYRFAYLIERAKGFASALAGFGGAFMAALERRDNEALSKLRQDQGLALARATRKQRELDVDTAREGLRAVDAQITAAEHRRDYYDELIAVGRDSYEQSELNARRSGIVMRVVATTHRMMAAVSSVVPEVNAPWSVSFGGQELSALANATAAAVSETASVVEARGALQALVGSQHRRARDWKQQMVAVRDELAVLARQRQISDLRLRAAEHALVLHDESVAQLEEVLAFEANRITNLGMQNRLVEALRKLQVGAYRHAWALARLAERAYEYERGDDGQDWIKADYWQDPQLGSFLAGERLLADLHALDRQFLETNHRDLEIDQPIPLSQIDAAALVQLRETGTCQFSIPEAAFDIAYPGHYRRRLRAVRLTIPCVTGPYVNVSAMLKLLHSEERFEADDEELTVVDSVHTKLIAASSAQADGGVFELSFRDERYLPFEGQGAISTWQLDLPKTVRGFDYASITDVIVSLAYSARHDDDRTALVESDPSAPGSLLEYYEQTPTLRIVSARRELGAAFARLLRSEAGSAVAFELNVDMLPPVFRGRAVEILEEDPAPFTMPAGIALRIAPGASLTNAEAPPATFALTVDDLPATPFAAEASLGGLLYAPVAWSGMTWSGSHTLKVTQVGGLGVGVNLDPDKLLDVLLVIPVRLAGA